MSGAFEVTAAGMLVHSKLTIPGHAKCQTALERQRVIAKLRRLVDAQDEGLHRSPRQ